MPLMKTGGRSPPATTNDSKASCRRRPNANGPKRSITCTSCVTRLLSFTLADMPPGSPTLSLVIPCYNEEGNLRPLIAAIREWVAPLRLGYEIVITDDRSKDTSWEILKELAAADPLIRVQRF